MKLLNTFSLALFLFASAGLMAQPMSGTYTVCASGCNYSTLGAAATALNTNGINGAVMINIAAGSHSGALTLNNITGSSATNTITFKGAGKTSTILSGTGIMIMLTGSRYIIFEDLGVINTTTSGSGAAFAGSATRNCTFRNCKIECPVSTTLNTYGFSFGSSFEHTYENLEIRGGKYGIQAYDYSSGGGNHKYYNNSITRFNLYGISSNAYNTGGSSQYIGNYIDSSLSPGGWCIRTEYEVGSIVKNNRLGVDSGPAGGFQLWYHNFYKWDGKVETVVSNNFIGSSARTIDTRVAYNTKFRHNTCYYRGTSTSVMAVFGIIYVTANNEVTNNSFTRTTPGKLVSINIGTSPTVYGNNYYDGTSSVSNVWNNTTYTTLASYITASGDSGAQSMAMPYLSSSNLHLNSAQPAPLSSYYANVDADIDGHARSMTNPTVGADESTYSPCNVVAGAGNDQVVYYGYSPKACATLTGSASNGTGGYSYSWSNTGTTQTITVCPSTTTDYILTVTDSLGCTASDTVTVNVVDVRCGNNMDKVLVCHNGNVICVSASAVAAHLNHGCNLGACPSLKKQLEFAEEDIHPEHAFTAYPNPFRGTTNIELTLAHDANVALEVYDLKGAKVATLYKGESEADEVHRFEFNGSAYGSSVYLVKLVSGTEVNYLKIIMVE